METISLLTYKKMIPVAQIKKSDKFDARDIDEEKPNKFVAYVDDGDECYDVCVEINAKKDIIASTCECENQNGFCVHKLALMRYLVTQKTKSTTLKVVSKRKLSESEELLLNIDSNALRLWAVDLFKKNKDLEILFLNEFKVSNVTLTVAEVKALITSTIKAVIKNRKNLDAALIKKTLDLLDSSLKSVMTNITSNISDIESVKLLHEIFQGITDFEENVYINSVKVQRFVEKLGNEFLGTLFNIKDFELWQQVVDQLYKIFLADEKQSYHLYSLNFIEQIYDKSGSIKERNIYFIEKQIDFFEKLKKHKVHLGDQKLLNLLDMCADNNIFEKNSIFFRPIKFANTYNEKLINLCIDSKKYSNAELFCLQQIEGNSYETYDLPYLRLLKKIYLLQDQEEKLFKTIAKLIVLEYNFEDYVFLKNHKSFLNFNDLKKKLQSNISNVFRSNNFAAQTFYLRIMLHDQDIEKLKVQLNKLISFEPIYEIFEKLIVVGRVDLLLIVCKTAMEHPWSIDKKSIESIQKSILANYSLQEIDDFKKKYKFIYSYKIFEPILDKKSS